MSRQKLDDDWHHRLREKRAAQAAGPSELLLAARTLTDGTTSEQRDDRIQVATRGGAEVVQQRVVK